MFGSQYMYCSRCSLIYTVPRGIDIQPRDASNIYNDGICVYARRIDGSRIHAWGPMCVQDVYVFGHRCNYFILYVWTIKKGFFL